MLATFSTNSSCSSAINLFSSTRQVAPNSQAGFCDTWIEKTFYTTEETFPTVLRRSEIVSSQVVETSPIENAINDVETRTRELHMLELKYKTLAQTERVVSTNPLTAALNNAVDSPDDSGVLLYRQAFLSPDYLTEHPDQVDAMHKLSVVIEDHVRSDYDYGVFRVPAHACPFSLGSSGSSLSGFAWLSLFFGNANLPRSPGSILPKELCGRD